MLKVKEVIHLYKTELIRQVARETRLPQRVVSDVVGATQRLIAETLRAGQSVTIPGFGTFYTRKRPASRIKDIRSGKMINIPERTVAAFRVGAILKRAVAEPRKRGRRRLLGL
ncbi:MAG: hypothetical protein DCC55_40745 [Chloroflexi bacterium]|nr:MAG: hypothetical protein DCC55_40745 [Chloroflexota bacterium]